jgi:hypothetical protein
MDIKISERIKINIATGDIDNINKNWFIFCTGSCCCDQQ